MHTQRRPGNSEEGLVDFSKAFYEVLWPTVRGAHRRGPLGGGSPGREAGSPGWASGACGEPPAQTAQEGCQVGCVQEEPGCCPGFKGTRELWAARPQALPETLLPTPPGRLPASSDHTQPPPCTRASLLAECYPPSGRTETLWGQGGSQGPLLTGHDPAQFPQAPSQALHASPGSRPSTTLKPSSPGAAKGGRPPARASPHPGC